MSTTGRAGPNKVHLSLTEQYAPHWKTREGIRELVQNWYDGCKQYLPLDADRSDFTVSVEHTPDTIVHTARVKGEAIGVIQHSRSTRTLQLVNRNNDIGLTRKTLLVGFSSKRGDANSVGEFGEGLKVGIIAMLREERSVCIETGGGEVWDFVLDTDPTFGERVLTVNIGTKVGSESGVGTGAPGGGSGLSDVFGWLGGEISNSTNGSTDNSSEALISSVVGNIGADEWTGFLRDFLFLCPPESTCVTELGTLLLDDDYSGQLYVKGFWVADMSEDGLATGVDFRVLEVDRDRRAVFRRQDIDYQISNMWILAIEQDESLIPRYYEMLTASSLCADVAKANWYLNDGVVQRIAARFFEVEGHDAFPISASSSNASKDVQTVRESLGRTPVVVNDVLASILAGHMGTLKDAVSSAERATATVVSLASLTEGERAVVARVNAVLGSMSSSERPLAWDVVLPARGAHSHANVNMLSGRVQISNSLLNTTNAHVLGNYCGGNELVDGVSECYCREVAILRCILSESAAYRAETGELLFLASSKASMESEFIDKTLHGLMSTVYGGGGAGPSNSGSSGGSGGSSGSGVHVAGGEVSNADLLRRENELTEQVSALSAALETAEADIVARVEARYSGRVEELTAQIRTLEADIQAKLAVGHAQLAELTHLRQMNAQLIEKEARAARACADLQGTMSEVSMRRVRAEAERDAALRRVNELASVVESGTTPDGAGPTESSLSDMSVDDLKVAISQREQGLALLRQTLVDKLETALHISTNRVRQLEDGHLCIICVTATANCVLRPCNHSSLCVECSGSVKQCPVCRARVESRLEIYPGQAS